MSNILIFDDEKAIRKTLGEILSYEGYKIDEAGDGEEGLKRFKEKSYECCWMATDINYDAAHLAKRVSNYYAVIC